VVLNGGANARPFEPSFVVSMRGRGDTVEVRVQDNGDCLPPTLRGKVFLRCFTTKPPERGPGLGLSISYGIVVSGHGGEIGFDTEEGRVTEFYVRVPRWREGS
jgi:signal transduction histidine kinase